MPVLVSVSEYFGTPVTLNKQTNKQTPLVRFFFQVEVQVEPRRVSCNINSSFLYFCPFPILVLSVPKEIALENCHAIILACYPLPPLMASPHFGSMHG